MGDETSLIVVGSHDKNGEVSPFSQTGPQVTLYALGEGGSCADYSGVDKYHTYDRGSTVYGESDHC
jgi:hypothetical protein